MEKMFINRFGTSGDEPIIHYSNNPRLEINSDLKIQGTERDLKNVDDTITTLVNILNSQYSVGGLYKTTDNTVDPNTFLPGSWTLLSSNVIDTGWQDFSWTSSTYIGTSQPDYTLNKWRIKDNILHIVIGAGATATIDTGNEDEIARIPISNTGLNNTSQRVWIGAVGGRGCVAGFSLEENSNGLSIVIKPHQSSSFAAAPWYSTHFTYPLPSNFVFSSGSYTREYVWKRTN